MILDPTEERRRLVALGRHPGNIAEAAREIRMSPVALQKWVAARRAKGLPLSIADETAPRSMPVPAYTPPITTTWPTPTPPQVVVKPNYRIVQRGADAADNVRVLLIGDCHDGPSIPKDRFRWMGRFAREHEVDRIVQIGDFATLDSLCRYTPNDTLEAREKPSFKADMLSFQQAVRTFAEGLDGYDCPRHVTLGNHEDRIWSFTNRNPEVVELLDQLLYATLEDHGWSYSPYGAWHFIGQVGFTHVPLTVMGRPYGGLQAQNQVARDALFDVVYGHSHKRVDNSFPKLNHESITVLNPGCALPHGHIEQYAKHSLTGWSYGVYLLTIKGGRLGERTWVPMSELEARYG